MNKKIVVFDFGSDYNESIVNKVKNMGVDSYLIDYQIKASELAKDDNIIGIILSGSRKSVYADDGKSMDVEVYNLGVPILGICYGMQLMAHQLGGKVEAMGFYEEANVEVIIDIESPLLSSNCLVHMHHGDHVSLLPPGFINYAHTSTTKHALMINEQAKLYATQFHPEKDESKVIERFVAGICQQ